MLFTLPYQTLNEISLCKMYERTFASFGILKAATMTFNVLRNMALDLCKWIEVSQKRAASVSWLISFFLKKSCNFFFFKLGDTSQQTMYLHLRQQLRYILLLAKFGMMIQKRQFEVSEGHGCVPNFKFCLRSQFFLMLSIPLF